MRTLKAIRELGLKRSLAFALYQAAKKTGWYRLQRPPRQVQPPPTVALPAFGPAPGGFGVDKAARERVQALLDGKVSLFGAVEAPLELAPTGSPSLWTAYDSGQIDGGDIKFTWEPARFGWVCDLVRVAAADGAGPLRAILAETWSGFIQANPPYHGPNWASGQEAALRLIHLVFTEAALGGAIPDFPLAVAAHAARLPPTLLYAHAQDNNHLLSEAAGLLTAGAVLPGHPAAPGWRRTGWRVFNAAVQRQFAETGEYVQQSANYHRMALMLAVWTARIARHAGLEFPPETAARLAAGTRWLLDLCDPRTGSIPNLGANDGARILPLSACPYADFRPELQAATWTFLGEPAFEPGPWDETRAWLRIGERPLAAAPRSAAFPAAFPAASSAPNASSAPAPTGMLRLDHPDLDSRAFLRAARFTGRPGHADQLHVDLWLNGVNIALDPGTFSYNDEPPWDNALQTAHHHNTLTVDGRDQMTRAGRFLYIDRAQATVLEIGPRRVVAEHDGYRALGLVHRRILEAIDGGWRVTDRLAGPAGPRWVRLHWLLPDWPWRVEGTRLTLERPLGLAGPLGSLHLDIRPPAGLPFALALARAGEPLLGPPPALTAGWFSPTYAVKAPALSFSVKFQAEAPVLIESIWLAG